MFFLSWSKLNTFIFNCAVPSMRSHNISLVFNEHYQKVFRQFCLFFLYKWCCWDVKSQRINFSVVVIYVIERWPSSTRKILACKNHAKIIINITMSIIAITMIIWEIPERWGQNWAENMQDFHMNISFMKSSYELPTYE